jgi:hypothetical protein
MKLLFRTLVFHLICIVFFATLYHYLEESFDDTSSNHKNKTFLDFFLLSSTIQAGIGFNFLDPITSVSKICVIIQQIVLISTHILTLYIFTL